MAFRGAVDRRILEALAGMADLPAAEAWRRSAVLAARYGARRPSYPTVRRALIEHRTAREMRAARHELRIGLLTDILTGRSPRRWIDALVLGPPGGETSGLPPARRRDPRPRKRGG